MTDDSESVPRGFFLFACTLTLLLGLGLGLGVCCLWTEDGGEAAKRLPRASLAGHWMTPRSRHRLLLKSDGTFTMSHSFARIAVSEESAGTWTADEDAVYLTVTSIDKVAVEHEPWRRYFSIEGPTTLRAPWWRPDAPQEAMLYKGASPLTDAK